MRWLSALFACLLFGGLISAQEPYVPPTPYEEALERIHYVRLHGDTALYLTNLELSELPPELWNLTQLEELYLGTTPYSDGRINQLSSLPAELGNLVNLKILDLSTNRLTSLPPEIVRLSKLQRLILRDNNFSVLPPEISQLKALCLLDLQDNSLGSLPAELAELPLLAETIDCHGYRGGLLLDGNPLISPPDEVIAQGTPAILEYLRNEAWWYLQKLIVSGLGILGLVTPSVLGLRWRNRRGKQKRKNEELYR